MSNDVKRRSVEHFKEFVKRHPKLRDEVRNGNKTWQQYYEEWYLYGEDSDIWKPYSDNRNNPQKDLISANDGNGYLGKVMSLVRNLNPDQIQGHLSNVNSTLTNIQQLISQFKSPSSTSQRNQNATQNQPFNFRKD
ncbi:YlbD family protein [Bacillus sp. RG28]|uniref:YlbD family protein n=1 Tax=Gottfriedia endophytica TaxID=2820819 RepID=A0A940SIT5_9BACI|nr:YlbD family protein [Gottfriedia endophytica]MBP0724786.1 YlbD family protein [Gottfriedia endophytica]